MALAIVSWIRRTSISTPQHSAMARLSNAELCMTIRSASNMCSSSSSEGSRISTEPSSRGAVRSSTCTGPSFTAHWATMISAAGVAK